MNAGKATQQQRAYRSDHLCTALEEKDQLRGQGNVFGGARVGTIVTRRQILQPSLRDC